MSGNIAVIDIGKTNAKLALVDSETFTEIAVKTTPNIVLLDPPWPHFNTEAIWNFLLGALKEFQRKHGIGKITVTTHGAAVVLLDEQGGLAAPVLDYEHSGPDDCRHDYEKIRPSFEETGSPKLAGGLNIGAQLYWQFQKDPSLKERTKHIVTYAQYWVYRLTGVPTTEVTSLGCHSDLWEPQKAKFSKLVRRLKIEDKIAPVKNAGDCVGNVLPEIAINAGLPENTPVCCGIHDSNASLVPHLLGNDAPFSVVSTGTWVIAMSVGGDSVTLDASRDTLLNINVFGDPVPSARFMGGREFDMLGGADCPQPSQQDIETVLNDEIMILPAVVPESGPFQGREMSWSGVEPPNASGVRSVAIGFYLASLTAECLRLIGHRGEILLEGPFSTNETYCVMLSVAASAPVIVAGQRTGTSQGAAMLLSAKLNKRERTGRRVRVSARRSAEYAAYSENWRRLSKGPI